jgi:hypothetical protein
MRPLLSELWRCGYRLPVFFLPSLSTLWFVCPFLAIAGTLLLLRGVKGGARHGYDPSFFCAPSTLAASEVLGAVGLSGYGVVVEVNGVRRTV